ncbi:MAG: hypothetical protein P0S93_02150 [Candidatus Neptunochlamydia sp.]|nr:hypothetical protein [Candidatus Neptunochlamydia sp.]
MILTPEEIIAEKKELDKDKALYPPFLVEEFRKGREETRIEERTGKSILYQPTKITDFLSLLCCIWRISNKAYQEEFWGKQGQWGDNYMETMEIFFGDSEAVLEANDAGRVSISPNQRKMLQELCNRIDRFFADPETPESEYGENDKAMINDPKWQKIGEYAKLVYEELSGDDLDAWEKQRK